MAVPHMCVCAFVYACGFPSVCMCVCVLEGIDLGVIHRKVLKFQSLLRRSLCALPKDETLMFYFPMSCLGIKGEKKKKEAEVC